MTKAPTPNEKSKKHRDNIKNATKNFDYTAIATHVDSLIFIMYHLFQFCALSTDS